MDKKTLQKKIESGDTVWAFSWTAGFKKEIVEINLQENEPEAKFNLLYFWDKDLIEHRYDLESIFATKEEAEWQLEFGNITRTEKLELPTWEQFKKTTCFDFVGIDWTFYELHNRRRNKLQLDYSYDNDYYRPEKEWKLTYENYLEACRLCKKLFLGGENDKRTIRRID